VIGTRLGRYEIVAEIGRGAMGVVYRARDPVLDRVVAVKTILVPADPAERADYEARFFQEAKAVGRLNHASIVTVYDAGNAGDVAFMAMEYVEGNELRDLVAGGARLAVARAVDIAAQIAEGLAYAHERGIVHRDVKPANVMVTADGRAKIMDFGIARIRVSDVQTQTGTRLGSPKYMSPEQVLGKRADARSDIFSLGVVLYEMLVGAPPFAGEDVNGLMYGIVHFEPPAPGRLNAEVPPMLDLVVAKALAKLPQERYRSAAELAGDLHECAKQLPARAASSVEKTVPLGDGGDAKSMTLAAVDTRIVPPGPHGPGVAGIGDESGSEPPVARGVSRQFDSVEAMRRLAADDGAPPRRKRASHAHATLKQRLALAASVTIALAVAFAIALG
jgi:serine/threonine-protein kinase